MPNNSTLLQYLIAYVISLHCFISVFWWSILFCSKCAKGLKARVKSLEVKSKCNLKYNICHQMQAPDVIMSIHGLCVFTSTKQNKKLFYQEKVWWRCPSYSFFFSSVHFFQTKGFTLKHYSSDWKKSRQLNFQIFLLFVFQNHTMQVFANFKCYREIFYCKENAHIINFWLLWSTGLLVNGALSLFGVKAGSKKKIIRKLNKVKLGYNEQLGTNQMSSL